MRINTNIPSQNAQSNATKNLRELDKSHAELASGSRINKAADDAARLSLSKEMEMNLKSMNQAGRNTNDAISLINIAEGSFSEMSTIMTRLREVAITASSDTVSSDERRFANTELNQLRAEMGRISASTRWSSNKLLNGQAGSLEFQVGINAEGEQNRLKVNFDDVDTRPESLGMKNMNFETKEGAQQSLDQIDQAQKSLGGKRAQLGALQNRLNSSYDNTGVSQQNTAHAKSALSDTDYAVSSSKAVQGEILDRAGVAVIAAANQSQTSVLKLI